ncbi:sulfotransferase family protein [Caenorhabditis elegans]|uniref:Uncharacterized protein n=1 Tax=Caenorhabditis elegans TaxID=6239 RepID=Q5FC32_CAEEL|nr:Uncharacterized protein CELE_T27C5.12 [Caenorhabditis elegans]CAI46585.1 Uncharacterized protein CELE_T27C5.12 [Caenorhabditis elegans]|eukprot:NP_001024165.1 Uncharacterized protein CELE_T27C5.12 [Caenorhabditis elegans]
MEERILKIGLIISLIIFMCKMHNFILTVDNCKKFNTSVNNVSEGSNDFIVPFINYTKYFITAPRNKIIMCGIRKSMSLLSTNIMCLLNNVDPFFANNDALNEDWKVERSCQRNHSFYFPPSELLNDSNTVRLAFIRDPFQRFVSFYLDKCVNSNMCQSCGTNMTCVVDKIYTGLRKIQTNWNGTVPFTDRMILHTATYSWNCDFRKDFSKWEFIYIEPEKHERIRAINHLSSVMKKQGVNETVIGRFQNDMKNGEISYATYKSQKRAEALRLVQEDPYIRNILHKIYYFDYVLFQLKKDALDAQFRSTI